MLGLTAMRSLLLTSALLLPCVGAAQSSAPAVAPAAAPAVRPELRMRLQGDTLVTLPGPSGAPGMRFLLLADTVWELDGTRRREATPERARVARLLVRFLGVRRQREINDSLLYARHPELRRVKP